jgi:hypothetical protein
MRSATRSRRWRARFQILRDELALTEEQSQLMNIVLRESDRLQRDDPQISWRSPGRSARR